MQFVGLFFHIVYLLAILLYINQIYLYNHTDSMYFLHKVILAGSAYPLAYDMGQMCKLGIVEYFSTVQNWFDFVFVWSGLLVVLIMNLDTTVSPFDLLPKILLQMVLFTSVPKTFFFLRIF